MKQFTKSKLLKEYQHEVKVETNLDKAIKLDKKAKLPSKIFSLIFGTIGALVLGVGMCLAMRVLGEGDLCFGFGIATGVIGIIMVSVNYPIYQRLLRIGKEKYSSAILSLINSDDE